MSIDATRWPVGAVLVLGALAWAANASSLQSKGALEAAPNVLTLKGSPFGRTLAVAMRGPVDVYWHKGEAHGTSIPTGGEQDCAHCSSEAEACATHTQTDAEGWREEVNGTKRATPQRWNLLTFALDELADWRKAYYTRTNPYGSTRQHEAYIMAETEKRLRLSYEMDPGNFSAYGSYFLFLSEALAAWEKDGNVETIHARARSAALQLSYRTVRVCLDRKDDPSALLTAGVAAHDHANLLFSMRTAEADASAGQFVMIQDSCLRDFDALKQRMKAAGLWDGIPGQRLLEMDVQESLLKKYREANISYLRTRSSRQTTNQTPPLPTS